MSSRLKRARGAFSVIGPAGPGAYRSSISLPDGLEGHARGGSGGAIPGTVAHRDGVRNADRALGGASE